MKHVLLIGAHPPTIGGVSIHVQRLRLRLLAAGWRVTVFDPYTARYKSSSDVISLRSPIGLLRFLTLATIKPPHLAHIHVSDLRRTWPIKFLCLALWRARRILTVHSGSFPSRASSASRKDYESMRSLLEMADHVIAVNTEIGTALRQISPSLPVTVAPPYLSATRPIISEKRDGIIASGYGTPIYGWKSILDAYERCSITCPLHLVFYNTYAPGYFEKIVALARKLGSRVTIHRDMSPNDFQALLASCHTYVRATDRDGDSIAVREAIDAGLRVIASDVVARPVGCLLYRHGDNAHLSELISTPVTSTTNPTSPDFFEAIIRCYGGVLNE